MEGVAERHMARPEGLQLKGEHIARPLFMSVVAAIVAACTAIGGQGPYVTAQEALGRPRRPADARISYGTDALQFGDLRVPQGEALHPVAVVIHGGCWTTIANLQYLDEFAEALTKHGWATWNIEYRVVGQPSGGWPGTFLDVGHAVDYLRQIAGPRRLDLNRVIAVGHSSGGHLALWAAARSKVQATSEIHLSDPLPMKGAISLGGLGDLQAFADDKDRACDAGVVSNLLGNPQGDIAGRYRAASPRELLPLGVPQLLLTGAADRSVPPIHVTRYAAAAQASGDQAQAVIVPNAGHFDVIAPWSPEWKGIEEAIAEFLNRVVSERR
jgi:acetyl esterase/lipase